MEGIGDKKRRLKGIESKKRNLEVLAVSKEEWKEYQVLKNWIG